jgi:threonine/homoserine/homoserine lactone efflux protein
MFGTTHTPEFLLTVVVLIIVPGPSVLFVVSRALALGRRAGLATVVGNTAGLALQVSVVVLGVGAIVTASAIAFVIVKLVGAAYLVVLGARVIRDRKKLAAVVDAATAPRSTSRIVREGFLVGATNPKGVLIFTAVLPQFVGRGAGHVPLQLAWLGGGCLVIALITDSCWACAASAVRELVRRSARSLELIAGASGLVMIGLGLRLAVSGRQS